MIKEITPQEFREHFQKLPIHLRNAISSTETSNIISDIAQKHALLIDKTGELAAETGLLMLGITHPNEFVGNLAERLQVDRAAASKIADDINQQIFAPVREHLRAMFGIAQEKEISPATQATAFVPQKSSALSAVAHQSPTRINNQPQQTASLEDLEAELERALMEEKGVQPLSIIKKPVGNPKPLISPEPSYKGADPYREQVEEDLPNTRGKAYAPENREQKKGAGVENQSTAFGFQSPVSRIPSAPIEEKHPAFSPLRTQEQPAEPARNNTLSAFRGFKMNPAASEQTQQNPNNERRDN